MLEDKRLTVIGTGTMGRAIIGGLIKSGKVDKSKIIGTDRTLRIANKAAEELDIEVSTDNEYAVSKANIVLLCVKPQNFEKILRGFHEKQLIRQDQLVISIVAGYSTRKIETLLGGETKVVRAMPNTPALINNGITVVSRGTYASEEDIKIAIDLFKAVGECIELEEKHLNTVTGLSGAGPAFVYIIIEALADGGLMMGLPRDVAVKLASYTVRGAADMVISTDKHPAALKDDVATPAGCTIGAILMLEDGKIRSVLARAVQEASHIASRLGD